MNLIKSYLIRKNLQNKFKIVYAIETLANKIQYGKGTKNNNK